MKNLVDLIEKAKIELVHSAYLSGWEIVHYKNLIKKLSEQIKNF